MIDEKTKVVIIGGAPTVKDVKLGSLVDAFDLVVRCNNYTTSGFEQYVGSKTDIWAINTSRSTKRRDCRVYKEVWHKNQPAHKLAAKMHQPKSVIRMLDPDQWDERFATMNEPNPSIGFRAIAHALHYYKDVTAFGFTFFTDTDDGFYKHYYEDVALKEYYKKFFIKGNWAKDEEEREIFKQALADNKNVVRGDHHKGALEKEHANKLYNEGTLKLLYPFEITDGKSDVI